MKQRVKLLSTPTGWGSSKQIAQLESQINDWLESHHDISIDRTHMISQPTFGWGQLAVAVWYRQHSVGNDD